MAYAEAIQSSGVKKVVYLSSYGAGLDKRTGVIVGSHLSEGILNKHKPVLGKAELQEFHGGVCSGLPIKIVNSTGYGTVPYQDHQ
ncbi:hypothetical protein FHW88_004957 [Mucilaginibacter sp. SG538B]|uniref:hypothetical protein n=1 Tax=Mucilaginibacter sp. SG538B TaxID=2587021 RepID=UPI00159DE3CA|nr:hypothetical protein [Mucilaginibacter sp. SG538B]NVM66639.1 hypothetical protein [Mucilaginibacter sp. SG538B]